MCKVLLTCCLCIFELEIDSEVHRSAFNTDEIQNTTSFSSMAEPDITMFSSQDSSSGSNTHPIPLSKWAVHGKPALHDFD